MLNAAFFPRGSLFLVGTSAVNVVVADGSGTPPTYRIKCVASSRSYLTWGNSNAVTSAGAPVAGTPSANTIGLDPGAVETLNGLQPWFIASAAAAFEILPGEGE